MTAGMDRRRALTAAAAAGIGAPLLAACGGDDGGTATGGGSGGALGPTSDVPVGGGTVFTDQEVVVTQPTEGDFKAFSSVCTHQGCQVEKVEDGQILCPCHGSAFSAEDGSVTTGPASEALGSVEITVDGDRISLA